MTILRWQRSGLLDSYPGTVRQVRSGRHGLSQTSLLTLEIGASTDGLGESEVVVAKGQVAGLVTGRSGDAYAALAAPVLAQFLEGATKGDWRGFARAGLAWQDLTNPALRESLGLRPGETGIRLTRVAAHGSAGGILKPGDVVLEMGGAKLDPTGYYEHPLYGRMLFALLFSDGRQARRHARGQGAPRRRAARSPDPAARDAPRAGPGPAVRLRPRARLRGRRRARLPGADPAVPRRPGGTGRAGRPPRLLVAIDREPDDAGAERQRIVLLSSVLPDAANLGYQELRDLIVERVNGRRDREPGPTCARPSPPPRGASTSWSSLAGQGDRPGRPRRGGGPGVRRSAFTRLTGSRGSTRAVPDPSVLGRFSGGGVD